MNVALPLWSSGHPEMTSFYAQVSVINALAEASPGFIWRLTDDAGDPTQLVNLSVWESQEALQDFVYRSSHAGVFRDRARWFSRPTQANQVLWWIPAGDRPGYGEGFAKLDLLRASGPTQAAFTFAALFPKPD